MDTPLVHESNQRYSPIAVLHCVLVLPAHCNQVLPESSNFDYGGPLTEILLLGIAGTAAEKDAAGRLFFFNGDEKNESVSGGPVIEPKTWNHVRLVRRGEEVAVYLNEAAEPILSGKVSVTRPDNCKDVFVGGRSDNFANLEGRMAEVAVCRG